MHQPKQPTWPPSAAASLCTLAWRSAKSHLLEDVYAYNDFSHTGDNPGCKPRRTVMQSRKKALLISEHTGHMYPTKSYDTWSHRQAQALRHARVIGGWGSPG